MDPDSFLSESSLFQSAAGLRSARADSPSPPRIGFGPSEAGEPPEQFLFRVSCGLHPLRCPPPEVLNLSGPAARLTFPVLYGATRVHASHVRYKTSSVALLNFFGDTPLDKITSEEVERFKTTRSVEFKTARGKGKGARVKTKKRVRPAIVNRELACLKAVFNFAIKADVVVRNPVSRVKFLAENNQQTRVLSHTEERDYFAKASPILRDVARLILETGMRPEKVYTIRPENVDLVRGVLQVPHGKTAAARRLLRLTSGALEVLRRRMTGLKTPYVFPCESDPERSIPKVNNAHDRAVKDSKIAPMRLYDLRHTWATRAAMSGIDLVTLAAMLGHSRIQMVLRYAHPTQEHQTQAMEQLEKFNAAQQIAAFEKQQPVMTQ